MALQSALWPGIGSVWIVGCGNMGGALLRRWLEAGLEPERVTVIDPAPRQIEGVQWVAASPDGSPDCLILGIKPQMLAELAPAIAVHVTAQTTLISILAGTECAALARHFPHARAIIRAMPNLPVMLGKGVTAFFAADADAAAKAAVDGLFAPTGLCEWLTTEDEFHAIIAVSGSGPAFAYRFIGALADGGAGLGLDPAQALRLACATVEGAAAMAATSDADPAELARRVTSPGGTTAAGLAVMDAGGDFLRIVHDTQKATANRSGEMASASRNQA